MISRIHDRLGTAGFVIAIIALVAALSGGAYAATNGLSGKQKKEVEKIAKKYAGKPGTNGTNGTNGKDGTNGTNGKDGAQGIQGKQGDQGIQGEQGPPGEPGILHPGETLPSGATETGAWNFVSNGATEQVVPIGFPIPLAAVDAEAMTVKFLNKTQESSAECPGTVEEPEAEPGVLCIYTTPLLTTFNGAAAAYKPISQKKFGELSEPYVPGVVSSGTYLDFENVSNGLTAGGTFAVTAPLGS